MFKVPEEYRIKKHPTMGSDETYGNNGYFVISFDYGRKAHIIASDGFQWEHVSVHMEINGKKEIPTWDDMCKVKSIFWSDQDTVMQLHPAKENYINVHNNVLHLWRPLNKSIPLPPKVFV